MTGEICDEDWLASTRSDLLALGYDEDIVDNGAFDIDDSVGLWLGDDYPPLTIEQIARAGTAGWSLNIVAASHNFDLREIQPALKQFSRILIDGETDVITGWEALEHAYGARRLSIKVATGYGVDLSALPDLESAEFTLVDTAPTGLERNPHLRELNITLRSPLPQFSVVAPLEVLSISSGREISNLNFMIDPTRLRELVIAESDIFDLSSLDRSPHVWRLAMIDCGKILGSQAITRLKDLRVLLLDGSRSFSASASLESLTLTEVSINPNYIADSQLTAKLKTRVSYVDIPPATTLGADR